MLKGRDIVLGDAEPEDDDEPPEILEELVDVEETSFSPKVMRDPGQPSAEEYEARRAAGHIPYRSWCSHCVEARATGAQHRHVKEESKVPQVCFD